MPWTTFVNAFTALPTAIALVPFFTMYWVTRYLLRIWLLVTYNPILSQPFEVLSDTIQCDIMRNKLWGRSKTASLNSIFL